MVRRAVAAAGTWAAMLAGLASVCAGEARTIHLSYGFAPPDIRARGEWVQVCVAGCGQTQQLGEPSLPFRTTRVLLPPGHTVVAVHARPSGMAGPLRLAGKVDFGRLPLPIGAPDGHRAARRALERPKAAIYDSDTPYPSHPAELVSVQRLCGYSIAILRIYPVQYVPKRGHLVACSRVDVDLELSAEAQGATPSAPLRAGNKSDAARAAALVDNPEVAQEYGAAPEAAAGSTYDYLLVTSAALLPAFQPLIDHKTAGGLLVKAETMANIEATVAGSDAAEKLRNYIRDAYANWGIQYVLLGGDTSTVPHRGAYGKVDSTTDTAIPCDLYFACLDGSWNGDGDGLWGEPTDGDSRGDVDLLAEVFVGRAPVDTVAEAQRFVAKTLAYAQNAHPNPRTALLLGEYLGNHDGVDAQGGDCLDALLPHLSGHTVEWLDDRSRSWDANDCIAALNGSPSLVAHTGHAGWTTVMRLFSAHLGDLSNPGLFLASSTGCYPGGFDCPGPDCIAEEFIKLTGQGAFAVVMNSRYGWFSATAEWRWSGEFQEAFYDQLLTQGNAHIGVAHQLAKHDMVGYVETSGTYMTYRWCYFTINLLGDPHTALQPASPPPTTLAVSTSVGSIAENAGAGATTGTVTRTGDTSGALAVALASSDTTEALVPASVTIAAGDSSASFAIDAVDDTEVDGTQTVTIAASAPACESGSATLEVTDNDVPLVLTLSVDPSSVPENAGPAATTGTVTRTGDTSSALTVALASSDPSEASVPASVTIPEGHSSAAFPVDAVDDAEVDGTQTVTVTGSADGFEAGIGTLDVTDNDSGAPTITVTSCPTEVAAGDPVTVTWEVVGATPGPHNHLHWRIVGGEWQGTGYTSTVPYTSTFKAPWEGCTLEVLVHVVIDGVSYYSDIHQITVTPPPTITVTSCPTEVPAGGQVEVTWEITNGTPGPHNHLHWRVLGGEWQGSPYAHKVPYTSSFSAPGEQCTLEVMVHAIIDKRDYYSDVHVVTVLPPPPPPEVTVISCPTVVEVRALVTVTWEVANGTPGVHNHLHWREVGGKWRTSSFARTVPYTSSFTAPRKACTLEVLVHAQIDKQDYYSAAQYITVTKAAAASDADGGTPADPAPSDNGLLILVVPDHGPAPLTVEAHALGVEPDDECRWELGDGTMAQGQVVTHIYCSPGSYTVTLRVGERTATATVTAHEPADF